MTKILVVSNMYPSESSKSFGVFVKNQVEDLIGKGIEVDVIAIDDHRMNKKAVLKKYFKWLNKLAGNFFLKGNTYDVVHCHYVFPSGLFGVLYKLIFRKKLVVTAHGGDINNMAKRNKVFRIMTKIILKCADHVIAVSEVLEETIITDYNIPKDKLSILNMGVNRDVFFPNPNPNSSSLNKVLFVGNIIRDKGVMEIIEAIERNVELRNLEFTMVGEKKDLEFFELVSRKIKKSNITNMSFVGARQQSELAKLMNNSQVLILPSYTEGFGLVALEAMSCNLFVIGTEVGGLKALLSNACGLLIKPRSAEDLAVALSYAFDNINITEIEEIKVNGLKKAEMNNSNLVVGRLIRIYEN
ncbi:glycosyltransferase [Rossellomorea marisflavi]|uniref:glycosyltransferase n=1 Tax=Rossellomorea marisflavi TaxID=189381 RepID=UPI00345933B6